LSKIIKSHQGTIILYDKYVEKKFNDGNKNEYSSIEHEVECINIFSCKYSPEIISTNFKDKLYTMVRYDIPFGTTKKLIEDNIKRILFSISKDELFKQLDEIVFSLKKFGLHHKDINPGNLIFSEKELLVKIIDFYWADSNLKKITNPPGGINGIYKTNDLQAINKIKTEINLVEKKIAKPIKNIKKLINKFGSKYYVGSSKHRGKSYTKINIPYFKNIPFHRNNSIEYNFIKNNITTDPKIILDVGCSTSYTIFNLIRDFSPKSVIGYEADPLVLQFLLNIKRVFCLNNIKFMDAVNLKTNFPKSDLVICMNIHMWLYKIFEKKADIIIKKLIASTKELFFQTAGAESSGMFTVKSLKSKQDIEKYLVRMGGKEITFLYTTKNHGGLRHMFKVGGGL